MCSIEKKKRENTGDTVQEAWAPSVNEKTKATRRWSLTVNSVRAHSRHHSHPPFRGDMEQGGGQLAQDTLSQGGPGPALSPQPCPPPCPTARLAVITQEKTNANQDGW